MTVLLSATPQYFSPLIEYQFTQAQRHLLFTFLLSNGEVLLILSTQIFILSASDFAVKEEILLESPIEAFKFIPEESKLTLKLIKIEQLDSPNITTITSKSCTWSLEYPPSSSSSPIFTLTFGVQQQLVESCVITNDFDGLILGIPQAIDEVIFGDYVAAFNAEACELLLMDKADRNKRLSKVQLKLNTSILAKSIIWNSEASISVFYIYLTSSTPSSLSPIASPVVKIQKFPLVNFVQVSNGCNLPLVAWCEEAIYAHRAVSICPTWYSLKSSEVWDCLDSQVGPVRDIQICGNGSCLFVSGQEGSAFCDFIKRTWNGLPLPDCRIIKSKWLGDKHVVALIPGTLILISREEGNSIMKIPVERPDHIKFIDTYNNWQLIIQNDQEITIFAFNCQEVKFTLLHKIPLKNDHKRIKQAAFLKESLFFLTLQGSLNSIKAQGDAEACVLSIGCESFLVLSTGHFLIFKLEGIFLLKDSKEWPIKSLIDHSKPLAALPFSNCLTLLTTEQENFNISAPLQSHFLLPDLFIACLDAQLLLLEWKDDPMYPLALEYILLESCGKEDFLAALDQFHTQDTQLALIFSQALVSICRKIEPHTASQQLFALLPSFSPGRVVETLCTSKKGDDFINFLPYLAKSYFEDFDERKNSITTLLLAIFARRSLYTRIGKVKEYLSGFADLQQIFETALNSKLTHLWTSGRLFKAFALLDAASYLSETIKFEGSIKEELVLVLRLDGLSCSEEERASFRDWLASRPDLANVAKCLDTNK